MAKLIGNFQAREPGNTTMSDENEIPVPAEPASPRRRLWLAGECAGLYAGVPAVYAAGWVPITIIPLLLLMTGGCGWWLHRQPQFSWRGLWRAAVPGAEWRRILILYAAAVPVLAGLLWWVEPGALFSLVRLHPGLWVLVMLVYPVLSVLPQELIYRGFFFERYAPLLGRGTVRMAASAVAFGFGHVIFHNWPAVVLTLAGGWQFATTYQRTGSLRAVSGEHALYGCAIFTLGYGRLFYEGTLHWVRG